jgi:GNAT superfamily N-acetyltransferase
MTTFRFSLVSEDADRVESLTRATGFFSPEEVAIARSLVVEALRDGDASGYHFVMLDAEPSDERTLVGFACFGPVPATRASFDLYWIVVHPDAQGRGLGRELLLCVEGAVVERGGRRLVADTSSRDLYAATRAFYERLGFVQAALLEDFYDDGDSKVIFVKPLSGPTLRRDGQAKPS